MRFAQLAAILANCLTGGRPLQPAPADHTRRPWRAEDFMPFPYAPREAEAPDPEREASAALEAQMGALAARSSRGIIRRPTKK